MPIISAPILQLSATDSFVVPPPLNIPITVAPVVDVAVHNLSTDEDQPVSINPLVTDSFEGPAAIQGATPINGSVSIVGNTLTFTPNANFNGTGSFTYDVASGGAIETGLVTVTVLPVNDPPTLDPIPAQPSLAVNAGQQIVALGGISAGPGEAQALTIAATSNNTALIPHPIVEYTSPGNTGLLRYTPQGGQGGVTVITVTVTDNGGGNDHVTRSFQVQVDTIFKNGFD